MPDIKNVRVQISALDSHRTKTGILPDSADVVDDDDDDGNDVNEDDDDDKVVDVGIDDIRIYEI